MTKKIKYQIEFELAQNLAKDVGKFLSSQHNKKIDSLKDKDIKLELDRLAENKIVSTLKSTNYSILSEEMGLLECVGDLIWIIDPIDGTLNYSRENPSSCISIALYQKDEPIFGVIYDFNRDELFSGYVGQGVWINSKMVEQRAKVALNQAILATGFPTYLQHDNATLEAFILQIQKYKKIRMIGSAALSLAYVAVNRFDTYMEKNIKLWDIAAGIAINRSLQKDISLEFSEDYLVDVKVGIFE